MRVARENMPNYVRLLTIFGNAQVRKEINRKSTLLATFRGRYGPTLPACLPACLPVGAPACLPACM